MTNTDRFFTRLPVNEIPLSELLLEEHLFYNVPRDWFLVITDIRNSTQAVQDGEHQTVNLVATGSIIAVLNIAYKADITIPFFFGGDGASFLVPASILPMVRDALVIHRHNTLKSFGIDLRVGIISVNEIYVSGQELRICKFRAGETLVIPIVLGEGLNYAEKKIKSGIGEQDEVENPEFTLDLSGMQCRWARIQPPDPNYEVVSLIVICRAGANQRRVFATVFNKVDEVYGLVVKRRPISIAKLKLTTAIARIRLEMRTRFAKYKPVLILMQWIRTLLGYFYFKTKPGKKYLNSLVEMTDTLVVDGKINTVISGSVEQRKKLEGFLEELEAGGQIVYGLHVSNESVMSCYVRNLNDKHIHFVDGGNGGYTKAAMMIKQKLGLASEGARRSVDAVQN